MSETLLQLKNASVHYGGVHAVDGVDITIDEGEIVALMGPNGAGKSTALKAIFGLAPCIPVRCYGAENHLCPIRTVWRLWVLHLCRKAGACFRILRLRKTWLTC